MRTPTGCASGFATRESASTRVRRASCLSRFSRDSRRARASAWRSSTKSCRPTRATSASNRSRSAAPNSSSNCRGAAPLASPVTSSTKTAQRTWLRRSGTNPMAQLLIVDDERSICELLEITFRKEGHRVETASSGDAAKRRLDSQIYDIVISDIRMPDMTGVELLQYCKETAPGTVFILITGVPTIGTAIDAVNYGADRYAIKGDRLLEELRPAVEQVAENLRLKKEAGELRRTVRRLTGLDHIIGTSPKMREIFELIQTVAPQSSRVLITGESGTGKELVARAIHENSARSKAPFITINCGAFPETLLESELFGYLKGAFTGANENRAGLFQAADGGTLLLDEIGETSLSMQIKLLRVLQERMLRPLGGTADIPVDVRLIAVTNRDLNAMVAAGQFREDFYYRISVIPVHVAPLRERTEDIEPLARHFMHKYAGETGRPVHDFNPETLGAIRRYSWPGNVRELENAIERAVAFAGDQDRLLLVSHLPDSVLRDAPLKSELVVVSREGVDFEREIAEREKRYLLEALQA